MFRLKYEFIIDIMENTIKIPSSSVFVNQLVKVLGKDVVEELQKQLKAKNKVATSNLVNSLSYKTVQLLQDFVINFSYEDYGKWVELGRKPGKYAPISKIKEWCKIKGIDESLAYPINYKIYKFGIKPTPFVQDVLKSNLINESINKMEEILSKDIEQNIYQLTEQMKDNYNKK